MYSVDRNRRTEPLKIPPDKTTNASTLTALRAGAEDAEFFLLNKTAFSAPDAQRRCVFSVRGSG